MEKQKTVSRSLNSYKVGPNGKSKHNKMIDDHFTVYLDTWELSIMLCNYNGETKSTFVSIVFYIFIILDC